MKYAMASSTAAVVHCFSWREPAEYGIIVGPSGRVLALRRNIEVVWFMVAEGLVTLV